MTWNRGRGLAMAGMALALAAGLSCSSSDPIQPNNGTLTLAAANVPAYADTFQWVRLQIDQITVRPLDPLTNSYLTAAPLGLLAGPIVVDVRSTAPTTLGSVPLKAGTYRVEQIRISGFELNVDPVAPFDAIVCDNGEVVVARAAGHTLMEIDPAPLLQIPHGGVSTINLSVDGPGVVQMLTGLPYDCFSVPRTYPIPTSAQLDPFISVN